MRPFRFGILITFLLLGANLSFGTILGTVRGIVHDPEHRPIQGAQVMVRATASDWTKTAVTDENGEFEIDAVPVGEYTLSASAPGFETLSITVTIQSGAAPILHFPLAISQVNQRVEVSGAPLAVNSQSSTTETLVNHQLIARTPGADRTDSLSMITDYVPGAYMIHDQLHIRGGHQVSWLIDGVPVPNTNIATNVGPQFDPKDVDELEVQRGGYSADYGDRTYGVFNVVPQSGFEGNNRGELVASYGTFQQTNDYTSFGSHTERFAYFASVDGNRTDLGLENPTSAVIHDMSDGVGGFGSFIFNATPNDQLRLVTSDRHDFFQAPNTSQQQSDGIRDTESENDNFVAFTWLHTVGQGLTASVSPFYHFNRAHYVGGPNDTPIIPDSDRGSQYAGGQASIAVVKGKHNARAGYTGFNQHDNTAFGITANDGSALALQQREKLWGSVNSLFTEDQFKATEWLTFNAGLRYTHYSGSIVENSTDPRVGVAIRLPRLDWVLRGFYGRYYQPPPLSTVSGPLLTFALQQGFGFLPLHGERDQEWEAGLAIPYRGWTLDTDYFQTRARNFFDHDVLGNSNIFIPLTIAGARIRGWEMTARSPRLFDRAEWHLAFSHQYAEGEGGVTGGLTDFTPPAQGYFFLDHDQRDTLTTGVDVTLPWRAWIATDVSYGSGFLDGDGPTHLPSHTEIDFSVAKQIGENLTLKFSSLNAANTRYLLDNSNTFGGTHFNDPRQISGQITWKFHY
jgi:outer membrane receptor protein involved in Fe transport